MFKINATGKWITGVMDQPRDKIGSIHVPLEAQKDKIRNMMVVDSVGSEVDLLPEIKEGDNIFVRGFTDIPNTPIAYVRVEDVLGHVEHEENETNYLANKGDS